MEPLFESEEVKKVKSYHKWPVAEKTAVVVSDHYSKWFEMLKYGDISQNTLG